MELIFKSALRVCADIVITKLIIMYYINLIKINAHMSTKEGWRVTLAFCDHSVKYIHLAF